MHKGVLRPRIIHKTIPGNLDSVHAWIHLHPRHYALTASTNHCSLLETRVQHSVLDTKGVPNIDGSLNTYDFLFQHMVVSIECSFTNLKAQQFSARLSTTSSAEQSSTPLILSSTKNTVLSSNFRPHQHNHSLYRFTAFNTPSGSHRVVTQSMFIKGGSINQIFLFNETNVSPFLCSLVTFRGSRNYLSHVRFSTPERCDQGGGSSSLNTPFQRAQYLPSRPFKRPSKPK